MLLKLNLYLRYPSPVTNKQFIGKTHTCPYSCGFIFSYLITYTCTSHIQALCVSQLSMSISVSLTCGGYTKEYQFCKYFWDHDTWSWPYFFFFFHYNGQPTLLGLPPTGRASRLPPDLGAVSSRPGQYLPAAKTQQMHCTQACITISGTNI